MKICLLGATFSTNNMGVGALTAGTIETILYHDPDAEICLLDYGKERLTYQFRYKGRVIPVRLINLRFSKKVYLNNNIALLLLLSLIIRMIPSSKVKEKIYSFNEYLHQIAQADIFASIAGGDSFSDIYGMARFYYVSLPQLLVLFMGKKLYLLPQTLGPFKGTIAKLVARYILRRSRLIYSRDYAGLEEMQKLLGKENISHKLKFCYDVGFVIDAVKPQRLDVNNDILRKKRVKPLVGVNVSGLLFMGGYTQNNMFDLKTDYRVLVNEIIHFMIKEKKASVLLVPHVFGSGDNPESDSVVCEKIYHELKSVYGDQISLVRGRYNQNEIKYIIGLCDFFIGSRMHACIAALSQCIPAVTIAYSKKFIGVMQTIGVAELVADPRKLEKDEILSIIDEAFEKRASLKGHLEKTMPLVKGTVHNLFREIYSIFNA